MFKNTLIIAGLLSVMSLSAQAVDTRTIIDKDTTINGISGITTTDNGNGGAVQNSGYNLTINGNFTNNTLENGTGQAVFGGAVYQAGGKLTINDGIVFDGNTVKSKSQTYPTWDGVDSASGGAIFITGANAQLKGNGTVTFSNNQAQAIGANDQSNGGALHIESIDSADFENVVFNSNSSKNRGGAVYVGDTAFTINGKGEFSDNSAMTGGAIYSLDTTGKTVIVTGSNSTFTNNTATGNGGSIANFDGTINVGQNNSFSGNNTAGKGGAIYNSNWQKTSTTNIEGGTSFTGNSAGDNGGAIYNSGNVNLDTGAGNITFSGNTAKAGADVYLDGADSKIVINGTNANNKVSFGSNGSIAGNGSITQQSAGTVEFKDNKNVDGFTGTYTQTSGKTSLNNSNMFNKYNISAGEFELLNGSNATIDNTNKIFNGSVLTIGGTSDNQSVLNIGTASDTVSIAQNVAINLQQGGKININNGSVILNNAVTRDVLGGGDTWQGDINTSAGGSLILDSFSHDTTTGSYTQSGGSLVLQGNSNLAMSDSASSITGGTVDIQTGNTLSVSNGSSIGGSTQTTVAGELNIGENGSITGGTTNVSGTMNVNKDGTVSGGTTNVDGTLNVANGGAITGGTTNVNDGGQLNVSGNINGSANTIIASGATVNVNGGTIDTTGKTDIQNGSTLNITNNGNVTLKEGDNWSGSIVNTGSNLTLNGIIHDTVNGSYSQNGGNLTLQNGSDLTLNAGSAITDGTVNIGNSIFNIASGGNVTGGEILVGDASTFNMADGAIMSGGKIEFTGETGTLGINGTVERDAVFDVLSNTVSIGQTGNVTLNKDSVTGDTWTDGTIALDGGTLNFEGTNNGTNGKFVGREGNLNISSGSQEFVIAENSILKNNVKTTVDAGSTVAVTGGQASFGSDDKIDGSLSISDGTLNLNNVTKGETFTQTGGTTNITGNFALDNTNDSVSGGTFNIGNENTAAAVNQSNGVIAEAANVNIANNSSLNITGGTTTLNGGETNADNWLGTVQLGGGELNLVDITEHGTLKADSGILNVNEQSNIIITGDSYIKDLTQLTLDGNMTISNNNEGAGVTIGSSSTWNGQITLEDGGNLTYLGGTSQNGGFIGNGGNLTIDSPTQNFVVADGSHINSGVNTVLNSGSTVAVTGGEASFDSADTINGNLSISSGTLNLDNVTKGGSLTQLGGTTNITGSFNFDNTNDNIYGGALNIGNETSSGTFNQSAGSIAEAADITIAGNSNFNITGGTTTLNGGETNADNWLGAVQLGETGVLNLKDINTHGALTTDGGTLNLANSNLTLLENSSIGKDTAVSFDNTNTIHINGGSAAFDGTEWGGSVTLDKGTLNYAGTSNGTLIANGGNLNTEEGSNLSINAGSYIEDAVTAAIAGNLTINGTDAENGGRVNLGDGDSVTGNISINNFGTLNMGDNVTMAEEGQTITFNGANAVMNLNGNNNLDLKAEITGSAGEINKNGAGNVIFSGTTGNYNGNLTINNSGDLTFVDENGFGGNLIFGDIDGKNIGIIADTIIGSTTLDRDANITYSTYRDVDLKFGNSVSVSKGSITAQARPGQNVIFDNQAIAQENGKLNASGQNVTFTNGAEISGNALLSATAVDKAVMNDITATDSTIRTSAAATEFNTLNLTNSNAFIMQNGFSSQAINIDGISGINVMNGTVTNNDMGAVNLTDGSTGNYSIDIAPRWWTNDKLLAGSVTTDGTATLNIDNFQFVGKAPIDRYIGIKIFESVNPMENILFTATDKEVFTPIGYYKLFSQGNGNYTAALTRYNDQVFRGQVATVANWQNQLVVNNVLFDHTQQINMQYLAQQNPNLYAAASPLFAPYQYNRKDGSLWFKSFGTFEKLSMTRDLNVNNNFYGALVGADFPAIDLKKGWSLLPTAYIGYTGAHQTYSGTSMYQNGGQGGAMATLMKKDFIGSLLVYGGGYGNTMDVRGFSDETANWFVGTAAKAAYNFHPTKRFIVQPNLLASYTMFGEQKWYTGYGDMTMYSKMLNGVNVAPGLNLIYGRETWSIYATVQYFYNILGQDSGYAGHVSLPDIGMRHGYLEYGFGFTKTWKDRFSAYAQFVIRNAGRTGVGVQGGLMYKL